MYGQPFFNASNIVTITLIIVLIIVVIRTLVSQSRSVKIQNNSQEALRRNEEHRRYIVEQNTMAHAKRDEQIRLLTELVELQKQSTENQKEMLKLLKRQ